MTAAASVKSILSDPAYQLLKAYVLEHTGLHYYSDKDEDFAARILRRISARGAAGCSSYLAMLRLESGGEPSEIEALIGELTIGETYFFRQPDHFDLLRSSILPEILQRNALSRRLRVWSAGCANGAEPYSIALLLQLEFGAALAGWDVSILGTDLNVEFLARARAGIFGDWALREVSAGLKETCFERDGNRWQLCARYRKNVSFEYNNLVASQPYPGSAGDPFDIILCRNVMIYLSRTRITEVAERLYDSLAEGGWLLVGHAEANTETFRQYSHGNHPAYGSYRKKPLTQAPPAALPFLPLFEPPRMPLPLTPTVVQAETPAVTADDARTLADCGQFERAAEICRRLIEAHPLHAPAHFTLGLIFEHTSYLTDAEAAFRKAIYLDRGLALAHYHLGTTLQVAGRFAAARKSFENVMELLADSPANTAVPLGDGLAARELLELSKMHLEFMPPAGKGG
jgi:chemotaxis protein methyltransferase CheR